MATKVNLLLPTILFRIHRNFLSNQHKVEIVDLFCFTLDLRFSLWFMSLHYIITFWSMFYCYYCYWWPLFPMHPESSSNQYTVDCWPVPCLCDRMSSVVNRVWIWSSSRLTAPIQSDPHWKQSTQILPLKHWNNLYKKLRNQRVVQFKIIINVLVSYRIHSVFL